ncbi:MAG: anion permease [Hyphomicrobiaceae bacterium]|nr:anion permease [Hyphomicrobiaceae bacterium]
MSVEQITASAIVVATIILFVWGRWRYDLVSVFALLAVVLTGLVPPQQAFLGFGHPAVLTVIGVLILSRGLQNAGIVDVVLRLLAPLKGRPAMQLTGQTIIIAVLSSFMNNVGALALMLPVAMRTAYRENFSPAIILMPLAFGSLLGGLTTLIGTPPNIIVSTFRQDSVGRPYAMFDFAPVGVAVAVAGIAFMMMFGWRLIPSDRRRALGAEAALKIEDYITEVRADEGSRAIGRTIGAVVSPAEGEVFVVALVRGESRDAAPRDDEPIRPGDVLILEGNPDALKTVIDDAGFSLVGSKETGPVPLKPENIGIVEAIVAPGSRIIQHSPASLHLRSAHGVNLLAISRHGRRISARLKDVRFRSGDVVLLHGPADSMAETLSELQCLPLAERTVGIGRPPRLIMASSLFVGAIAVTLLGLLPVQVAFIGAAALMAATGVLKLDEAYGAIDWPVIVLIGAMFPVGAALEATGTATLVANGLLSIVSDMGPAWALLVLLVVTMTLSDVINNSATALVMAPIGVSMAAQLGASPDPFLMAVAVGSSSAFLTPIGHQNNALILEPGGYRFGDYWRMGLPLEVVIVAVAVPMILVVWPL